jgi:N-acetylmuramoyl-L-alanine amidase
VVIVKKPVLEPDTNQTSTLPVQQTIKEKEVIKSPTITEAPPVNISNVIFKVQLMASAKKIPLEPGQFKGLHTLSKEPVRNLFRYMYGNTGSYKEALLLKSNANEKGYTTSYIVAYKDGVRIPTPKAIKLVSE